MLGQRLPNFLTGRDVSIVSDIAGTTRDVMRATFTYKGSDFTVLDTAGIRRKGKVEEDVEYYSVNRAIKAIDEADVVLLMVDVLEGLSEQDKKIASLIVRQGKGIILVLNKIDLLPGVPNEMEAIKDRVRFLFPILSFAPMIPVSAKKGQDVGKLLDTVWAVWKQLNKRVDTGIFNQALRSWCAEYQPPRSADGHYKILYGTQVSINPVRFLLFVNKVKAFPETYLSYIKNQMRSTLGINYIPIEISVRERKRNPSLHEKGLDKEEVEIQKITKRTSGADKAKPKGTMRKPGGKARIGKAREAATRQVKRDRKSVV